VGGFPGKSLRLSNFAGLNASNSLQARRSELIPPCCFISSNNLAAAYLCAARSGIIDRAHFLRRFAASPFVFLGFEI